ncbi:hypothetical protein BU17DRAFT_65194 [Hysterangium stoloniferum]|nr:hypothetical protein BU17DRAFT_65194 [Hysterangium stoloniferum]
MAKNDELSEPKSPSPREVDDELASEKIGKLLAPYSHSPWPVWSLSTFFLGTSAIGFSNPALPPFALRFGFGLIFAGAGYVTSTGDVENGSAITTSWAGSYFLMNGLRKELAKHRGRPMPKMRLWQRPPLVLALNSATLITMALYGAEYFWFQNFRRKTTHNFNDILYPYGYYFDIIGATLRDLSIADSLHKAPLLHKWICILAGS